MDLFNIHLCENDSKILIGKMILEELKSIHIEVKTGFKILQDILHELNHDKSFSNGHSDASNNKNSINGQKEALNVDTKTVDSGKPQKLIRNKPDASGIAENKEFVNAYDALDDKPCSVQLNPNSSNESQQCSTLSFSDGSAVGQKAYDDDSQHKKSFKVCFKKKTKINYSCKRKLCEICGEYKTNMWRHKRTHTGEKRFKCSECGKAFIDASKLSAHCRIHSGEKPYTCDICDDKLSTVESLRKHTLMHRSKKPHGCPYCKKSYTRKWLLTKHIRSHTKEKPFQCKMCSKSYPGFGSLRQHMRTHGISSNGLLFPCNVCKKKFRSNADLVRHSRVHTGVKPFTCDLCNTSFTLKGSLTTHMMRVHLND